VQSLKKSGTRLPKWDAFCGVGTVLTFNFMDQILFKKKSKKRAAPAWLRVATTVDATISGQNPIASGKSMNHLL
jgi:hypothetical protein